MFQAKENSTKPENDSGRRKRRDVESKTLVRTTLIKELIFLGFTLTVVP